VALRAPVLSSLLARLRRSRPAEPTCAATPRQFRDPGRSLSWVCRSHARDERPRHETQVGMVDAFAACLNLLDGHLSDTSLLCPPNRVKLKVNDSDLLWGIDMTKIGCGKDGLASLFAIVDHCDRECVGFRLSLDAKAERAREALAQAVAYRLGSPKAVPADLQIRADNGSQSGSRAFVNEVDR